MMIAYHPVDQDDPLWHSRDGKVCRISKLAVGHAINLLPFLERHAVFYREKYLLDEMMKFFDGEPDDFDIPFPGKGDHEYLHNPHAPYEARVEFHRLWCVEWMKGTNLYNAVQRRVEEGMKSKLVELGVR